MRWLLDMTLEIGNSACPIRTWPGAACGAQILADTGLWAAVSLALVIVLGLLSRRIVKLNPSDERAAAPSV